MPRLVSPINNYPHYRILRRVNNLFDNVPGYREDYVAAIIAATEDPNLQGDAREAAIDDINNWVDGKRYVFYALACSTTDYFAQNPAARVDYAVLHAFQIANPVPLEGGSKRNLRRTKKSGSKG